MGKPYCLPYGNLIAFLMGSLGPTREMGKGRRENKAKGKGGKGEKGGRKGNTLLLPLRKPYCFPHGKLRARDPPSNALRVMLPSKAAREMGKG